VNIAEDAAGLGHCGVVHDKPQGAIEILPRRQHDGEFTGDLGERCLVETTAAAELDLQLAQSRRRSAGLARNTRWP
jgi:hypothetical protein